jgi:acyl-coenzyme A thioesterase 1/2/4
MESAVACKAAPDQGQDVFLNTAPLFKPLWARGAFGGALIGQSLSAAQKTVPAEFLVESMHCHFFIAAKSDVPVFYHVERIRDGRSIVTRSVRAMQTGKCIFSATVSFAGALPRGTQTLEHQPLTPLSTVGSVIQSRQRSATGLVDDACPFESIRLPADDGHKRPELQRLRNVVRGRFDTKRPKRSSPHNDTNMHLASLAYISDNYFIGTVHRVHGASRFNNKPVVGRIVNSLSANHRDEAASRFEALASEESAEMTSSGAISSVAGAERPKIEMMASIDHTIFFHNQAAVATDDWMVSEMEALWAGQERGLVLQRIWTSKGVLIATCIQEGLVRLSQKEDKSHSHL